MVESSSFLCALFLLKLSLPSRREGLGGVLGSYHQMPFDVRFLFHSVPGNESSEKSALLFLQRSNTAQGCSLTSPPPLESWAGFGCLKFTSTMALNAPSVFPSWEAISPG